MTTDPTMRIVWYLGKPYGISSKPFGPTAPATEWQVLMPSGWLPLFPYRDGTTGQQSSDAFSTGLQRVEASRAAHNGVGQTPNLGRG